MRKIESVLAAREGRETDQLEAELSLKADGFSLATDSVFSAYLLALTAFGVAAGDTVVLGSLCRRQALAALLTLGARVLIVDCSPTEPTSPLALERALMKSPSLAVTVGGEHSATFKAANVAQISEIYTKDCYACVLNLADYGGLSTQGGAVIFSDESAYMRAKTLRDGNPRPHKNSDFNVPKIPVKLARVEASIALARLEKSTFPHHAGARVFETYTKAFDGERGAESLPAPLNEAFSGYPLKLNEKEGLTARSFCAFLHSEGVQARTLNLPLQLLINPQNNEMYSLKNTPEYYPHEDGLDLSLGLYRTVVLLPAHPRLSRLQIHKIISSARFFISQANKRV